MNTTNVTQLRNNIFSVLENVLKYNETTLVTSKNGNVVLISEDDYNSIQETLYLTSIPGMEKELLEGVNTPISECIHEDDVEW